MNKIFILVSTLAIFLANAQNNEDLKKEFERQKIKNNEKFDSYVSKVYGANKSTELQQEIEKQRVNLAGFLPNGNPYFHQSEDMDQINNSNSDFLQNGTITGLTGSFNGEGIKFTIFDGSTSIGPARVYADHILFNNTPNRITNKENSTLGYGDHATAVAGFIGAKSYPFTFSNGRQVNFKGIAPNSTIDAYAFGNTTLPGDTSESTVFQKILIAQPSISNHSYGVNQGWTQQVINGSPAWLWQGSFTSPAAYKDLQGTYFTNDMNYDQIVYNNPSYVIVKSSGNYYGDGPNGSLSNYYKDASGNFIAFAATDTLPPNNCSQGNDCIGPGSLAKNIIVAGAADIITANGGRYTTPTDVVHSSYSSAGPRDDGAIKPDISTVGTNVAHANTTAAGSNSVATGSGTSYSAPIVTGIIGLWTQINKQLFAGNGLNAASAKTLMIHSASEAGNMGPDPKFGWGFINAKKGAELLVGKSNNTVIFNNETLNNGSTNIQTVTASGSEPLKVTISWIDPEFTNISNQFSELHNNRYSKLINDLDLRITDMTTNTTVYTPWKLDALSPMTPATKGDNTVDNVEQVIIDAPTAGRTYKIEVSHKGTLKNNSGATSPQNYSIIITGHNQTLGTAETSALSKLTIAPTLTKDIVKVLKAPKKSTFNVYDLSGKKLQNGLIKNDEESIDLSSYTKGIYIIEIKSGKDVISKKVIKE
ncbi:putative secreted protein (Por secretion system target) [Chryseobacterium sp. 52]|uniref:S8 family peptidase n=1 Tax=Chryseobacterium sp. 52 TaxID=2035213 RepID=UPI000C17DA8D|nr:S8 family peptidase [Chryseobacterium sp. 52]PIF44969.1 putative secreted protein (Por secretion system target) [Chryseobacterium sp. 52]